MTLTSSEGHRVSEPALSSLASTPAVSHAAQRKVSPPPSSSMGVEYVSLMACAEIIVSDYKAANKSKFLDNAARK